MGVGSAKDVGVCLFLSCYQVNLHILTVKEKVLVTGQMICVSVAARKTAFNKNYSGSFPPDP